MKTQFTILSTVFALLLMSGCSNKGDVETAEQEKLEKLANEKLSDKKAETEAQLEKERAETEAKLEREKAEAEAQLEKERAEVEAKLQAEKEIETEKVRVLLEKKRVAVESTHTHIKEIKSSPIKIGSTALSSDKKDSLNSVAEFLNKYPSASTTINAYTDSTGTERANLNLSQKRADVAKEYLISNGVSQEQVNAIGYGASNFISDDSENVENRRIEINLDSN